MDNDIEKTLYSAEDIKAAAHHLGMQIARDYADKKPILVSVLKGAILWTVDVMREMDIMAEVDFIDVSSYHGGLASAGEIQLIHDLSVDVKDRNIIIMEDIIDTGRTLKYLIDLLNSRGAKDIKVCTMLDKPEGRVVPAKADYVGFQLPKEFVVGYGLDYKEFYRNLPYVGVLKPAIYENN